MAQFSSIAGMRAAISEEREAVERLRRDQADLLRRIERMSERMETLEARQHELRLQLSAAPTAPAPAPAPSPAVLRAAAAPLTQADGTLGRQIRSARQARGLSISQAAARLQVSHAAVWMWENDRCRPSQRLVKRVAQLLRLPPALLGARA